jgi:N-acetylmuramic acid 6-phosphate etherase
MTLVCASITGTITACATSMPLTEQTNKKSRHLDSLTALEIVTLMNQEDHAIAQAITPCLPEIAQAIEHITHALKHGGRLMYIGAGSSGRLGVLDASECPPTFSAPRGQVVGIIAGGEKALRDAVESVEDDGNLGIHDLNALHLSSNDVVCGISASGSAPYVCHALRYAHEIGCFTIMLSCNPHHNLNALVDCYIVPEVGPEILTGSTRLKAGTATKMVLNMLSTASYVVLGKVYQNYMVDLVPLNQKLIKRATTILEQILTIDTPTAEKLLAMSNNNVKTAIIMQSLNLTYDDACTLLNEHAYSPLQEIIDRCHKKDYEQLATVGEQSC